MDQRRFDRLTAILISETGRRRALAGLLAGTTAFLAQGKTTTAKKRKNTCKGCPQRACCSCRSALQGPATKCITIGGITNLNDAQALCVEFCGQPALVFTFNFQVPGLANACAADFDCVVKDCPVNLKA